MSRLQDIIDRSRKIVFFGGAGVSTESGIPDFRSPDGLYSQKFSYPPETILSLSFFSTNPEEFFAFYRAKILGYNANPNPAHLKLAELERAGRLLSVVTQNIDGLHRLAGSSRIWELHGCVDRNRCLSCGKNYDAEYILRSEGVPRCGDCGGIIKPEVVLYEEGLDERVLTGAISDIARADTLIVAGTSLTVYPAAGLLRYFKGINFVIINRDATAFDNHADLVLREPVGKVMAEIIVR